MSATPAARNALPAGPAWLPAFRPSQLVVIAAIVGAIVNVLLRPDVHANPDSHSFEALARSLLAGQGLVYREPMFPELPLYAFRSPGYSVFLAAGLWLGGESGVLVLQGAMNGIAAVLVGSLAGRWGGSLAAWAAFALRLLWPAGWFHAGQFMSEAFFEFTTILAVWLAARGEAGRQLRWLALAGAVAGVAVLTRPVGLGCLAAIGLWLLLRQFPRGAAVMAATAVLLWLPWPIRNHARLQAFVPLLSSGSAATWCFQSGQEPGVAWAFMRDHVDMGEVGLDRHFRAATREILQSDPAGYARRIARSALEYAAPVSDRRPDLWMHRFALLALLPMLLRPGWWSAAALPLLVWAAEGALLVLIFVHSRFRYPTEWCVVIAAALGLATATTRWGGRRTAWLSAGALVVSMVVTRLLAR